MKKNENKDEDDVADYIFALCIITLLYMFVLSIIGTEPFKKIPFLILFIR